jgi:hypothetical protein
LSLFTTALLIDWQGMLCFLVSGKMSGKNCGVSHFQLISIPRPLVNLWGESNIKIGAATAFNEYQWQTR